MWVFALYTMIDGYFVTNYVGEIQFSAVNISMPLITSFFAIAMLFSIGTQAKIGYSLGQNNIDEANVIFKTSFVSLVFLGLIYTLILFIFHKNIISLLGTNSTTFEYVKEYILIIIPFAVFFMTTYQLECIVKIDGFPHISSISVFTAAMTNLILDYIFIVPFGMGLFGAGLATGLAQVVSTVLLLVHFKRKKGKLAIKKKKNFKYLKEVLPLGLGDAFAEISIGYTVFLFNTNLLKVFGQNGLVVYSVVSYISIFAQVTMTGIAQGFAPLFSYDYGQKAFKKIKNTLLAGVCFASVICLVFIYIANFNSEYFIELFLDEGSNLLVDSKLALKKYSLCYIFMGFNILMVTLFASLGEGKMSVAVSLLRTPILISIVMFIYEKFFSDDKIWYLLIYSEGLTSLIAIFLLYHSIIKPLNRLMEEENN